MSKTLFISDLHLDESTPEITELFLLFLAHTASKADALYILGDLFEAWIGDDENTRLHQKVSNALRQLAEKNVKIYFIHGNRDFLVGKHFAKNAGLTFLPDPCLINLYGKSIMISHGDFLCTDDISYQRFRKKIRNPFIQFLFLKLPLTLRKKIAAKMRQKSKLHTGQTSLDIMDVNQQEVRTILNKENVDFLIHGHTHRPAIHRTDNNIRIVLPDWHMSGGMLEYTNTHQFFLKTFNHFSYSNLEEKMESPSC